MSQISKISPYVKKRRHAMNRKWTDEMDNELRRLYPCTTAKETARMLGVTQMAVQQRAIRLGLRKGCDWRKIRLTQEQKNWLRRNYPDMANAICALYLGVSESSVARIARGMGLRKTEQFMREAQLHAARKAKESHLRNGTYPPKGWYSPNLRKGVEYMQKRKMERLCKQ